MLTFVRFARPRLLGKEGTMAKRRRKFVNPNHPLSAYLRNQGITQAEFAEKAFMAPHTVHKIMDLNGSQLSFVTLWKLNWATDGIVSPSILRRYEHRTNGRNKDFIQHWHDTLWRELD
jgi:hypothetical protein